ncbi:MAG TPA: hypothetical protein VMD58_02735 [Acidobacteriaceae bacterium]|nr:hypothetical protein [Acidobacteriaceae bacterium]
MYALCRHIMPTGHHCQSPALTGQRFCYHHSRQRRLTARPKRPHSITIPFEFPEDRAAIQTNYQLTVLSIVEGRLEPRQANAIIHAYRAAAVNLKTGPLTNPSPANRVDRVILTPEEEEIAPPREALEPGETLTHGPKCPCGCCADTYRNAPPEPHHLNCPCGDCRDEESATSVDRHPEEPAVSSTQPHLSAEQKNNDCHPERSAKHEVEGPAVAFDCHPERSAKHAVEEPAVPSTIPALHADAAPAPTRRTRAARLRPALIEVTPTPPETNEEEDEPVSESPYQAVIREYHEQSAARQSSATTGSGHGSRTSGWREARVPGRRVLPEGIRRYNELMAQIERNKQAAEASWQRFVAAERAAGREVIDPLANKGVLVTHPDGTTTKRYLTWSEEEDTRRAEWQRLLDEEQSRESGPVVRT